MATAQGYAWKLHQYPELANSLGTSLIIRQNGLLG
jgi:hypothetical protein